MLRTLIIGGYGNFGGYVARALASDPRIQLILAGRDGAKAEAAAKALHAANPAEGIAFDLTGPRDGLVRHKPDLVINMVGPYHTQSYAAAEAAIAAGAHYCDIADAREFVCNIGELDAAAKAAGLAVIAGASSVPALTAAYCDAALTQMAELHSVEYGISGAEQANRGAGTVAAVLSYVGKPFTRLVSGEMKETIGWSDIHSVPIGELGGRWFGQGNVPDLALFPERYPHLRNHTFWAGHEIAVLHWGTWAMSLLVRAGLLPRLDRFASQLSALSKLFNWMGRSRSGFFMNIKGVDAQGKPVTKHHTIVARSGHGPIIPIIPVILLARKFAAGEHIAPGARPCLDLITLDEYRGEFADLDVSWSDA
ncbi:saccharopine dehydrogenase NADP-binding domain-containing protein [Aurantiacibacter sp. D1-12]|uniref:saccharopine dehydrogenase NADP-binding domain-containing protein n=1 Tax=Aurantiacibacter sp. D1-12 TaxID=2993658 RepID=UPI00237CA1A6|nr:saccharopine dehydrogenase NADP-binding domain-containing protein [Aurantiacibacter sp. D1-12]MDE1468301.1 saccharopine dehydrogenase NADP-binding domain-containing protein [Aurantiacibacter sp. D1-12]